MYVIDPKVKEVLEQKNVFPLDSIETESGGETGEAWVFLKNDKTLNILCKEKIDKSKLIFKNNMMFVV